MSLPLLAHAQSRPPIQMSFAIPTLVDPAKLFLNTPGQSYSETNDPNSRSNGPITGMTFLPVGIGGLGGLEIHGNFPGAAPIPVGEIDFSLPYIGALTLTTTEDQGILDPQTGLPYAPWLAVDHGIQNNLHSFTLRPQPGSAPLDASDFFGVLTADATGVDSGTLAAFQGAGFSSAGFVTTPEPGAAALLLGVVFSGSLLASRRRKDRKSA